MCIEASFLISPLANHHNCIFRHQTRFWENSHTQIAYSVKKHFRSKRSLDMGNDCVIEDRCARIEARTGGWDSSIYIYIKVDEDIRPQWLTASRRRTLDRYGTKIFQVRAAIRQYLGYYNDDANLSKRGNHLVARKRIGNRLLNRKELIRMNPTYWSEFFHKLDQTTPDMLFGKITFANIDKAHKIWCGI